MATATVSTIEKLERSLVLAEQEALELFWEFALQAALADRGEGQAPAIPELRTTLEAAGKTPEEFRKAVDLKRKRLTCAAQLEKAEDAEKRVDTAKAALESFNADFLQRYHADCAKAEELRRAVESAENAMLRCVDAELELRQTSPDVRPWLYSTRPGQPTPLGRFMMDLDMRIRNLRPDVAGRRADLERRSGSIASRFSPTYMRTLRDELAAKEAQLASLEGQYEQCKAAAERGVVPDDIVLLP